MSWKDLHKKWKKMHLITQIFSLLVNICEEIRNIEIISFFLSFHPGMSIRTFCHDENILYLSCLIKQPLVSCDYWTLKMWLLQLRNWPFNFIIWFAFEYSHVTTILYSVVLDVCFYLLLQFQRNLLYIILLDG